MSGGWNEPHWSANVKPALSRIERNRRRLKVFMLECVLWRGEHIKAPLQRVKTLAAIRNDRKTDVAESRRFWADVRRELIVAEVPPEYRERVEAQIAKRIPMPLV